MAFSRPDGSRYSGQLKMADEGFVVRGSSPADFASGNALTNYAADALVFTPAGEKSFRVARCDDRVVAAREFTDCPLVTLRDTGTRS